MKKLQRIYWYIKKLILTGFLFFFLQFNCLSQSVPSITSDSLFSIYDNYPEIWNTQFAGTGRDIELLSAYLKDGKAQKNYIRIYYLYFRQSLLYPQLYKPNDVYLIFASATETAKENKDLYHTGRIYFSYSLWLNRYGQLDSALYYIERAGVLLNQAYKFNHNLKSIRELMVAVYSNSAFYLLNSIHDDDSEAVRNKLSIKMINALLKGDSLQSVLYRGDICKYDLTIYQYLAEVYGKYLRDISQSEFFYRTGYQYALSCGVHEKLRELNLSYGFTLYRTENYQKANDLFKLAYSDTLLRSTVLSNATINNNNANLMGLALTYIKLNAPDSAIALTNQFLSDTINQRNSLQVVEVSSDMAEMLFDIDEFNECRRYLDIAKSFLTESDPSLVFRYGDFTYKHQNSRITFFKSKIQSLEDRLNEKRRVPFWLKITILLGLLGLLIFLLLYFGQVYASKQWSKKI